MSDHNPAGTASAAAEPVPFAFVALMAFLFATIALSIDSMLPALPAIARDLTPEAPNRAQLVITSFVFGMGLGTLVMGPLSDRFGRRRVLLGGMLAYLASALAAWGAGSLTTLLLARAAMGFAVAAPRVVSMAIVRDLYAGRAMARILSLVMMVFTLVPAMAPLLGSLILTWADWHGIFLALMLFGLFAASWFALAQPETLPLARRKSLALSSLLAASREVLSHRTVVLSILAQTLTLGMLFATLSSMHGIFEQRFDRAASFPYWFALIAVLSMSGSMANARLVRRVGMRKMLVRTYAGQAMISGALLLVSLAGIVPEGLAFALHILWSVGLFAMMGVTNGNLSAMAMEPLGHVAGLAASLISAIATVGSVALAIPVGLALDGTQAPLLAGVTLFAALAFGLMRAVPLTSGAGRAGA